MHLVYPDGSSAEIESVDELYTQFPKLVLYFYPKDDTPGCTREAHDFSALRARFDLTGYQIIGVSRDDTTSHQNFATKCSINFPLLSDPDLVLHNDHTTWGKKKNFGREYEGTIRSTFVIDNGHVTHEWRHVRVAGHAEEVLDAVQTDFAAGGQENLKTMLPH